MKIYSLVPVTASIIFFASCQNQPSSTIVADTLSSANPFFGKSSLPYEAPAFGKIKNSDFKPAMEEGMKQKLSEIQQIADNPDSPTFENTLTAFEKAGQLLERTQLVFNVLTGANTNPELQNLQVFEAPRLAANADSIFMNSKLFKRVETLFDRREQLNLDAESRRLLEFEYQEFELAGAKLSDQDKEQLKKLNEQDASLSAQFTNRLLGANKAAALVISDKSELNGLPQETLDADAQIPIQPGNKKDTF
jgi:peptidyl-dipeptidase Dcp